jgi:hypothetical protein
VAVPAGRRVELELSLRQRPVVRGRVLVGGRPTPGIHVMARATSDDGRRQAPKSQSSGADGRFELELAAQGTCVLQAVSPAGGSSPEAKVHVRWGERREQDLVFGDGELRGRVEAADGGAPVPDAAVRLRGLGEELTEWLAVDAASTFRFADLAPGTYFVEAVSPDLANVHSEPIVIDGAGPTAMLVLRLERGARLLGSVHYADGDSHADVVHLLRRDDPLFHRSATPEDGAFAFGGLAAGSYRLLLTKAWADPLTDDEHEDAGNVVQECGLVIDGPGVHRRDIVVP